MLAGFLGKLIGPSPGRFTTRPAMETIDESRSPRCSIRILEDGESKCRELLAMTESPSHGAHPPTSVTHECDSFHSSTSSTLPATRQPGNLELFGLARRNMPRLTCYERGGVDAGVVVRTPEPRVLCSWRSETTAKCGTPHDGVVGVEASFVESSSIGNNCSSWWTTRPEIIPTPCPSRGVSKSGPRYVTSKHRLVEREGGRSTDDDCLGELRESLLVTPRRSGRKGNLARHRDNVAPSFGTAAICSGYGIWI
ncbi:hypothetical protein B0J18DRAFT_289762 [Chaetomium sp. MPI-SDFR-AT-0129]|nr:hypothetical protein B0J18DRAFT_289762 [Chaetomium sp. MPI-SDFR-AT-0129]